MLDQIAERVGDDVLGRPEEKADLRPAPSIREQQRHAGSSSTASSARRQIAARPACARCSRARGVSYKPFWIVNAIRVTGDRGPAAELAARPEVSGSSPTGRLPLPEPIRGHDRGAVDAVEWGIDRIRAAEVWSTSASAARASSSPTSTPACSTTTRRSSASTAATGRRHLRPQLQLVRPVPCLRQPVARPCDNNGHGTHTMGTMVGDDGGGQPDRRRARRASGSRPRAASATVLRRRAARLAASGCWRPTDLDRPEPATRPAARTSSTTPGAAAAATRGTRRRSTPGSPPASSPRSPTATPARAAAPSGSPGDYPSSYGAGAFDINNAIAGFSSRGPSAFGGEIKPNIAAPGVNVRSSVPEQRRTQRSAAPRWPRRTWPARWR